MKKNRTLGKFEVSKENTQLMKKIENLSWKEITKPLKKAMKKTGLKEKDVPELVHKLRSKKNKTV